MVVTPPFLLSVAELKHIFNELHYEMTRKIAEGGMGLVYEAVQLEPAISGRSSR